MKKFFALVLCCITTIGLSGCVTFPSPLDIRSEAEEITAIEVYCFDEPVYLSYQTEDWVYKNWQEDGTCEEIPYTGEPIAYVEETDFESFVSDAEALPFTMTVLVGAAMDPAWYYIGYVVKIYCGEDYELVTNYAGGHLRHCEEEVWQDFLKKYIGAEHFGLSQESTEA